jgi:hypothetical protein
VRGLGFADEPVPPHPSPLPNGERGPTVHVVEACTGQER